MHSLWTLKGLGVAEPAQPGVIESMTKALKSKSAGVRRAAVQSLPNDPKSAEVIVEQGLLNDADPQVRLAAYLQISDSQAKPKSNQIAPALSKVDDVTLGDPWLLDAWTSAAASRVSETLPLLLESKTPWSELLAGRVTILSSHLGRSKPTAEQFSALLKAIEKANGSNANAVLEGLARGWPLDHSIQVDDATGSTLVAVMEKLPVSGKSLLVQLASRLGAATLKDQVEKIAGQLLLIAENPSASAAEKIEATKQLVTMQPNDDAMVDKILKAISPQTSPNVAAGFLSSLINSKAARVAPAIIEKLSSLTPDLKESALRVLMARPETTRSLLNAISEGKVAMNDLQLDQRQALRDHPDRQIRDLALKVMETSGGVPSANRVKVLEDWMAVTEQKGDADKGKALYKKHCALCHQHSGEGNNIGPDLTGMAVHPKMNSCSIFSIPTEASKETSASIPS